MDDVFQSSKLLHLDMYQSHVVKYIYMQMHHMLPELLLQNYSPNELIHSYIQGSDIHSEHSYKHIGANSFIYFGPICWSSLPVELKARTINFDSHTAANN